MLQVLDHRQIYEVCQTVETFENFYKQKKITTFLSLVHAALIVTQPFQQSAISSQRFQELSEQHRDHSGRETLVLFTPHNYCHIVG